MMQATHTSLSIALTVHMLSRVLLCTYENGRNVGCTAVQAAFCIFLIGCRRKNIRTGHKNFSINCKKLILEEIRWKIIFYKLNVNDRK